MESLSDMKIKCLGNDETTFPCHKIMLATSSTVFKDMFGNGNVSDRNDGVVKVSKDSKTMAALLNFVYTGELDETKITASLMIAADKYDIKQLTVFVKV